MELKILYISSMMICAIALSVLYICNLRDWKNIYVNPLAWIYIMNIISALANACWKVVDGVPNLYKWNYAFNEIEYLSNIISSLCWFFYTCQFTLIPFLKKKTVKRLFVIPAIIAVLVIVTSPFNQLSICVDSNGVYHRGSNYIVQIITYGYMAVATIFTILSDRKAKFTSQKRHFFAMVMFSVFPLVLGSMQFLMPPSVIPTIQYSVFLSLLLIYANEQELKITRDSLTGLPNRYEFERVVYERMMKAKKNETDSLYVLVGDLDKFKNINDNYGHVEGDKALQTAGLILSETVQGYDAIVARMSGDEFCIAVTLENEEAVCKMIDQIEKNIKAFKPEKPYGMSISFGYSKYEGNKSLIELTNEADKKMYESKRK